VAVLQSIDQCPPFPVVEGVEFRHCPTWIGYAAGNDGSVWVCYPNNRHTTILKWRRLKEHRTASGYLYANVRQPHTGNIRFRSIAPMVCEAFHGPRPKGLDCCHNDGTRDNNVPNNLRWDTVKGNMQDAIREGRFVGRVGQRGETGSQAKLSNTDVQEIRRLHGVVPATELAKRYGVHVVHIRSIHCGRQRKWG
jgi:hypothetical protein